MINLEILFRHSHLTVSKYVDDEFALSLVNDLINDIYRCILLSELLYL